MTEDEKLEVTVAALRGRDVWRCVHCGTRRTAPKRWTARADAAGRIWLRCACSDAQRCRPHRCVKHEPFTDV